MAAAGVPGMWEWSTERVPMIPAIAARLGAEPVIPVTRPGGCLVAKGLMLNLRGAM